MYLAVLSKGQVSFWIRLTLECGILYLGAANAHLHCLDDLQFRIESHAHLFFPSLKCCCLLVGEGCGILQTYCPQFCGNQSHCRSHHLYCWNPTEHLCSVNPPIISEHWTDSKHSWLAIATAADIWNGVLASWLILQGEASSWHTILKDVQCCICTWLV